MSIRKKLIQRKVEEILSRAAINEPPVNLLTIAESLKLKIVSDYKPPESDVSGCLIRKDGQGIIGINPSQSESRKRFTIAHEIGHFILHTGEEIHLDRAQSFRVNFRDSKSSVAVYPDEMEANFFAAELLMPTEFVSRDIQTMDLAPEDDSMLQELAERYQVSIQALTYRLINLGFLPGN